MTAETNPLDDPSDAAQYAAHAGALAAAIDRAIPAWVERCVIRALRAAGRSIDGGLRARVTEAGRAARTDGGERLRVLLLTDVDQQRSNPLDVLRSLVRYPTEVLQAEGVRPPERDEFAVRAFPDDPYDLSPASFADVDPSLHEPGLVWGAAKAHLVLARRRREGRR